MESIAAKAIRDGVLDATIDHATGTLVSKEQGDVYATLEPGAAFHKRITFCLNLHNDAVKAMSYPFDAHKDQVSPSPSPSPNPSPSPSPNPNPNPNPDPHPSPNPNQLPDAETIKERQREEQELAQSLAEEEDDDF